MNRSIVTCLAFGAAALAACAHGDAPTAPAGPSFTNAPCSATGTLSLAAAQAARIDCTNGGTTVTLAGNGASYLVVAQFAADLVPNSSVPYHLSSGVRAVQHRGQRSCPVLHLTSSSRARGSLATDVPPCATSRQTARVRSHASRASATADRVRRVAPSSDAVAGSRRGVGERGHVGSPICWQLARLPRHRQRERHCLFQRRRSARVRRNERAALRRYPRAGERLHVSAAAGVRPAVRPDAISYNYRGVRTAERHRSEWASDHADVAGGQRPHLGV